MDWSPTVAYCVGLIATDGCLSGDGRHVEFSSKDRELVEHVKGCFGPTNRITPKARGDGIRWYHRVQIGKRELYQWLHAVGLTPHKSLTLGPLNIPDEYFADFLRGDLDGDGNIMRYQDSAFPNSLRLYIRFNSASRAHLNWLQITVSRLWMIKGYQTTVTREFRLNYAKRASIELARRLYYAEDVPCLLRKRRLIESFLIRAEVAELADAIGSGPIDRKVMGVRVPPSAFSDGRFGMRIAE